MYHGHFATGLLVKAIYGPSIPAWPIMMGSSILDIIGGLGLYEKLPVLSWVLECILCIVLAGAARQISKNRCGADITTACALLAVLSLLMSPWTSPLLLVAHIYERYGFGNYLSLVQAFGFWTAYIVPATVFSNILDKADQDALVEKKR
jgi:hypothetical protein